MTDAQKRFVDEYLIDLNATRAYKIAYARCKKETTANVNSCKLLRNAKIQEYITKKQKEIEERTEVTQDRVIKELANIAFFNIKNVYSKVGELKNIEDIEEETARAIASVKVLQQKETTEIKTWDKVKALELLGKHIGMFKETNININTNFEDYVRRVERR